VTASPHGATPDDASPDGASPHGASSDGLRAGRLLRERARQGLARLDVTWWSIVQCAVAAALAWSVAARVFGHPLPIFAAVAAVISLGVSLGVAIGDLIIHRIGSGPVQLGLVVLLGMSIAQFLDSGMLVTNQAAMQAIFVTMLPPPPGGVVTRWEDAVIGGSVALVVAAAAPRDPRRGISRRAEELTRALATSVEEAARAVRHDDPELAGRALGRLRGTQPLIDRSEAALRAGLEISRISPLRRGHRHDLAVYAAVLAGLDWAIRNMRVALRRVDATLDRGESLPRPVADILDDLAESLDLMRADLGRSPGLQSHDAHSRRALVVLARRLDPDELGGGALGATVVVAQVQSAVVDLLIAHGVERDQARALLPRRS
jgi:uncharacterized membrane protein YgaE (UPF0421/DUF939 family)